MAEGLVGDVRIRRARPEDAAAYHEVVLVSSEQAYAAIMPPAFFAQRRAEAPQRVEALVQALTREQQADSDTGPVLHISRACDVAVGPAGNRPAALLGHWVAEDEDGVAAICTIGHGQEDWERGLGLPPPPVPTQVTQLYALPRTHGTGLAQTLLESVLPRPCGAHLWVMCHNPRAERFYARNGFVPEGLVVPAGESWFHRPMQRLWRPDDLDLSSG